MANVPEKFDIKKWLSGFASPVSWSKDIKTIVVLALVLVGAYSLWYTFFRKEPKNINNQRVTTTPFSHVDKIDQSNTQVNFEEKSWEVGVGVGAVTYDNKNGAFGGVWVKKKF
jgi:membrane protein implicated in regulation of membrane protease activity